MKSQKTNNRGMTFPELILAILMLTAFTGVTVMVIEYTSRFFEPLNEGAKQDNILLEEEEEELTDMLNINYKINTTFDSVIEFLSEPGIDKDFIADLECTNDPREKWNIPSIEEKAIPGSYKICIKPTKSFPESSLSELLNNEGDPGIYILYSKPEGGVSFKATPQRRIFCRPKPFCKKEL